MNREEAEKTLERYTATGIVLSQHSPAYELVLRKDGEPVAVVSNEGRGGPEKWGPYLRAGVKHTEGDYTVAFDVAREAEREVGEAVKAYVAELRGATNRLKARFMDGEAANHAIPGLADGHPNARKAFEAFVAVMVNETRW